MKKFIRRPPLAWLGCILFPLPALIFWKSDEGQTIALGLFYIGCSNWVASLFQPEINPRSNIESEQLRLLWRRRMTTAGLGLLTAFVVFSLLWLMLIDPRDFVALVLAFLLLIPALCVVPLLTLVTRKQLAAVVFALFAVFCMKLLGCIVVVLVYGWNASRRVPPYTDLPWDHPNLLVCLFVLNTAILSLLLCIWGKRKFQTPHERVVVGG